MPEPLGVDGPRLATGYHGLEDKIMTITITLSEILDKCYDWEEY
jgi:hypothetical protein